MRVGVLVAQVVDVVGGHRPEAGLLGEQRELGEQLALLGQAGVLELDVDVLGAEQLRKAADLGQRGGVVAVAQQHRGLAAHAAGERDEALVVPAEQLPVGARLVVVALEVRRRRQLDEVLVAGLVAGEQREVRVALLDPGAAAAVGGHVELEADDRLDALFFGGAVELDGAAQRAVVGERHRRHAQFLGPFDQLLDPAGAVEQRVFAVHVEMDECGGHGWPDSSMTEPPRRRRSAAGPDVSRGIRGPRGRPDRPGPTGVGRGGSVEVGRPSGGRRPSERGLVALSRPVSSALSPSAPSSSVWATRCDRASSAPPSPCRPPCDPCRSAPQWRRR